MQPGEAPPRTLRALVAERVLSAEPDALLAEHVERLRAQLADAVDAVVFFGSRRTGAAKANAFSAYDLFFVVESYLPFYRALRSGGLIGKSPALLASVSRWLPPTQISIRLRMPEIHIKGSVMRRDTFLSETSPWRRDHFTAGRLFQPSRILLARTPGIEAEVLQALVSAHVETWRWCRPWLPAELDADTYGRRTLEVSMSWEIRPEPPGRAAALWEAQRPLQRPVFEALLEEKEREGELARVAAAPAPAGIAGADDAAGGSRPRWRVTRPPGGAELLRLRLYFTRSIARATLRWAKHVVSFEGWLDYIVRKASRHTGETIELSDRERRWPLVFLWGRVYRYLRDKNRKGAAR